LTTAGLAACESAAAAVALPEAAAGNAFAPECSLGTVVGTLGF